MNKLRLIIITGFAILTVLAFFAFNRFIYHQKQAGGVVPQPYEATITGEYVCLPHSDTSGPQTLECAFGLKTDTGEFYAIDFGELPPTNFIGGQRATVTGIITPIEYLSSDAWMKYAIQGIFSVKQLLQNK